MGRVLVIRFSSLGDIVLTFPSIERLVSQGAEVHVLTKRSFEPLLKIHGKTTQIHTISDRASLKELITKLDQIKKCDFEQVFDLHRNLRSLISVLYLRIPYRRVSKFRFRELFLLLFRQKLFLKFGFRPVDRKQAALATVADQAKLLNSGIQNQKSKKHSLAEKKIVCISIESAWRQKEWPKERFLELARRIESLGYSIAFVGLRPITKEVISEGWQDYTGKQTIQEVSSTLASARLFVGNDSGLMHLAESQGTPVVAIFGPTSRELGFAPSLSRSRVVEKQMWCRPCSKNGRLCIRPIQRRKCLSDIAVDDVFAAAKGILESGA